MVDVIDSLVVTLGLDASKFTPQQKAAVEALKKTREEAARTAKETEAGGRKMGEAFAGVRNQLLGLFAVILGGKSLIDFARDATNNLSEMGRVAKDVGASSRDMIVLQNAVRANGGTAEEVTQTFVGLSQAIAKAKIGQFDPGFATMIGRVGASITDSPETILAKFHGWAAQMLGTGQMTRAEIITIGQMGGLSIGVMRELMKSERDFRNDIADAGKKVPSVEVIERLTAMQAAFIRLRQNVDVTMDNILGDWAPVVSEILTDTDKWISDNPELAKGIGEFGVALVGLGAGILSLQGVLSLLMLINPELVIFLAAATALAALASHPKEAAAAATGAGAAAPGEVLQGGDFAGMGAGVASSMPMGPPRRNMSGRVVIPIPPLGAANDAAAAAQRTQAATGIPAAVTMAQYILESANGTRMPPGSNNPFGIKARPGEPYVEAMTTEVEGGQERRVMARFRKFESMEEAFTARARLLQSPRYAAALRDKGDPEAYADDIARAGYATDPDYAAKLKQIMRQNNLARAGNLDNATAAAITQSTTIHNLTIHTRADTPEGIAESFARDRTITQANSGMVP